MTSCNSGINSSVGFASAACALWTQSCQSHICISKSAGRAGRTCAATQLPSSSDLISIHNMLNSSSPTRGRRATPLDPRTAAIVAQDQNMQNSQCLLVNAHSPDSDRWQDTCGAADPARRRTIAAYTIPSKVDELYRAYALGHDLY